MFNNFNKSQNKLKNSKDYNTLETRKVQCNLEVNKKKVFKEKIQVD